MSITGSFAVGRRWFHPPANAKLLKELFLKRIADGEKLSIRPAADLPPTASVLVPIFYDSSNELHILFTLRAGSLSQHKGEVSFPGGRIDADDINPYAAALRETHEEIGLSPDFIELWGALNPSAGKDGKKSILPIVGLIKKPNFDICCDLWPHEDEVELVFSRSVTSLCNDVNSKHTQFRYSQRKTAGYALPVFDGGPYRIWGLTAIILHQFLLHLVPGLYRPSLRFVKAFR